MTCGNPSKRHVSAEPVLLRVLSPGRYNLRGCRLKKTKTRLTPNPVKMRAFLLRTKHGKQPRGCRGSLPLRSSSWALGYWSSRAAAAPPSLPRGTGLAPADPYAPKLPISGIQMSEAASFSGAKVTYIDGQITNSGDRTVIAITVQVGFHNDTGQFAQRIAVPLSLIRTREPYVDTQPVSAAPIEPGQTRDFRLIFDTMPADWNQQVPEIRIISVRSR